MSTTMETWEVDGERVIQVGRTEGRPTLKALIAKLDNIPQDIVYEDGKLMSQNDFTYYLRPIFLDYKDSIMVCILLKLLCPRGIRGEGILWQQFEVRIF